MDQPNQGEPNEPAPPRRTRLEDEVLEILTRTDQPASLGDHVRRKAAHQRRERLERARGMVTPARGGFQLDPTTALVGSFVAAFLALLIRDTSALLATLLAVASVGLLLWPIVDRFRRPQQTDLKRWRGRDVDMSQPPPAWVRSLQDRFRRPPKI